MKQAEANAQYPEIERLTRRCALPRRSPRDFGVWLHTVAALFLLLFGVSHFGFLALPDSTRDLRNVVFPFLTNGALYFVVALIETSAGLLCFKYRGQRTTNVAILTFVGVILWYRWAFAYTGGAYCGCLGLLGRLLHLNKTEEQIIPVATLTLLVLTTLPWLFQCCGKLVLRCLNPSVWAGLLMVAHLEVYGTSTIEIKGTVDIQEYNPKTGRPFAEQQSHNTFEAILSGDSWRFSVTNVVWPKWWAQLIFDGASTHLIMPFKTAVTPPFGGFGNTNPPHTDTLTAIIEPSGRFIHHVTDNLGISLLWTTYALSPRSVRTNETGLISMPLSGARENPAAFGYKWVIEPLPDGRWARTCQIVRDKALDLPEKAELFRRELDYPETLGIYNEYAQNLALRKDVPTGFVKANYVCTEWRQQNEFVIPVASVYEVYLGPSSVAHPWRVVTLKAAEVAVRSTEGELLPGLLPPINATTEVIDYRYKRTNKSRIFKYAKYTLNAGDSWKPANDPILLAQAADWLSHGRKFTVYVNRQKIWTTWILLAAVLSPLVIVWSRRKNKTAGKKNTQ